MSFLRKHPAELNRITTKLIKTSESVIMIEQSINFATKLEKVLGKDKVTVDYMLLLNNELFPAAYSQTFIIKYSFTLPGTIVSHSWEAGSSFRGIPFLS